VYVFGPYKGAKYEDLPQLDKGLGAIAKHFLRAKHPTDFTEEMYTRLVRTKGTGSAGGLVASLMILFDKAKIVSGVEYVNYVIDLENEILNSEVVLTGEGSLDDSDIERGKMVTVIHKICKKHNKPLIIVGGVNKLSEQNIKNWKEGYPNFAIVDIVSICGIERSLRSTAECLATITDEVLIHKIKDFMV
jgi:glycerate kinase